MRDRYAQCDGTCTVDCGACKGERRPTADVAREPTASRELREAIVGALADRLNPRTGMSERAVGRLADAVLALPELAALVADAANWRRVTTGDPTEPEPLAMQARTLLLAIKRVRALHVSDGDQVGADPDRPSCDGCRAECSYCESEHEWPCPTIEALDGEPQP